MATPPALSATFCINPLLLVRLELVAIPEKLCSIGGCLVGVREILESLR